MGKIERLWLSTIKLYYSKKCKILYLTIVQKTASIRKTAYKTLKPFFYSPNSSQVICSQTLIFKLVLLRDFGSIFPFKTQITRKLFEG